MDDHVCETAALKKNSKIERKKEIESKREKNASVQDFMLWLLTALSDEATVEITAENEVAVTDVFGNEFNLKITKTNRRPKNEPK